MPTQRRSSVWVNAVVILLAAFMSSQFSFRLRWAHADQMIQSTYGTLRGDPQLPEFQNRILFPLVMTGARAVLPAGVSDVQLWKGLRFVTAVAGFMMLFASLRALTGSAARARVGTMLAAYGYLWTPTTLYLELPMDFLDVGFTALFVLFALKERYGLLIAAVILASLNRESSAFSGLIVLGIVAARHGVSRTAARGVVMGAACIAVAVVTVGAIRSAFSGQIAVQQNIAIFDTLGDWRWAFLPYGPGTGFVAMFLPAALALWRFPGRFSTDQWGLLWGFALCFIPTAIFGALFELRVLLPCYVVLVFVVVLHAANKSDDWWTAWMFGDGPVEPPAAKP